MQNMCDMYLKYFQTKEKRLDDPRHAKTQKAELKMLESVMPKKFFGDVHFSLWLGVNPDKLTVVWKFRLTMLNLGNCPLGASLPVTHVPRLPRQ